MQEQGQEQEQRQKAKNSVSLPILWNRRKQSARSLPSAHRFL